MAALQVFALLLVGHAVADYPLQGNFLSRAKNRLNPLPDMPWQTGLWAHSTIHAGAVGILTGSLVLGLAEFVAHALIDDAKCMRRISTVTDQALHVACKAAWAGLYFVFGPLP